MFDALIDEIATLHHQIHENDIVPADEWERQAAHIFTGTQRILLELINNNVGLRTLELGLLYNWLRLATLNRGYDDNHFNTVAANLERVMKRLVTELKAIEAELKDDGPTAAVAELGAKIQQLREQFGPLDNTDLPRHQIERQTAQTMKALFSFTTECLKQEMHPGLLESAMLYYWLRTSTVTASVDEPKAFGVGERSEHFFQKMERHWPEVFKRVGQMTSQMLKGQ
jgi:hypothetical protein